jgi:hypothetical protein
MRLYVTPPPTRQQNNKEIFKSVLAGILSGIFTHETTNCLNLLPSDVLAPEFPDQIRLDLQRRQFYLLQSRFPRSKQGFVCG